jgi:hypothetical protein
MRELNSKMGKFNIAIDHIKYNAIKKLEALQAEIDAGAKDALAKKAVVAIAADSFNRGVDYYNHLARLQQDAMTQEMARAQYNSFSDNRFQPPFFGLQYNPLNNPYNLLGQAASSYKVALR